MNAKNKRGSGKIGERRIRGVLTQSVRIAYRASGMPGKIGERRARGVLTKSVCEADRATCRQERLVSGEPDLNWRPLPWQGSVLPLNYRRKTQFCVGKKIQRIFSPPQLLILNAHCGLSFFFCAKTRNRTRITCSSDTRLDQLGNLGRLLSYCPEKLFIRKAHLGEIYRAKRTFFVEKIHLGSLTILVSRDSLISCWSIFVGPRGLEPLTSSV